MTFLFSHSVYFKQIFILKDHFEMAIKINHFNDSKTNADASYVVLRSSFACITTLAQHDMSTSCSCTLLDFTGAREPMNPGCPS